MEAKACDGESHHVVVICARPHTEKIGSQQREDIDSLYPKSRK